MFQIVHSDEDKIEVSIDLQKIEFHFNEFIPDSFVEAIYNLEFDTDGTEYVLLPACCYNGNCFKVLKKSYPPMFDKEEQGTNIEITITDVPRLNKDGSGKIEVTTGDVSVPCVGIYSKEKKQGILLYTIQQIDGINLGLSYEKGKIGITYPHMRKNSIYRWPFMKAGQDTGLDFEKGKCIEIPYKVLQFTCESMEEFYEVYFKHRKCMNLDCSYPEVLPKEMQFEILKNKFNRLNWREEGQFYGVGTENIPGQIWQPGWVGGGISSYPLMKLGGELEWERGMKTLKHLFNTQAPSGFFYASAEQDGNITSSENNEYYHLCRGSGDILYFIFKHFDVMKEKKQEIPPSFIEGTKKLADAFVSMWKRYRQFGQFINTITGEIVVGGSTNGGIIPAGLVSAYRLFNNMEYLNTAKESAEMYYIRDAAKGYTTGGPGEILQGSDSESCSGLLESYVCLYEETQEEKWLTLAKYTANLFSSWVVAYNYVFPEKSEFARLDMKTVGSVFANVQNKHSAPGICTLSGNSLYKLYRWTNNIKYLELYKDITSTINQYMSTTNRPIFSWDVPKDASLLNDDSLVVEREQLPEGFICERVNMSDWESYRCIGGVFNGSCWPETTNLLILAEDVFVD